MSQPRPAAGDARAAFNDAVRDAARVLAREALSPQSSPTALTELVRRAVALADEIGAGISRRAIANMNAIACTKGCAWCCHLPVGVTAPQALAIAAHIRTGRAAISEPEAKSRLRLRAKRSPEAFAPCAFLVDGLCAIYEVRPFACRGANSIDAEACREFVERGAPPDREWVHALPYEAMAALQDGLVAGTAEMGLEPARLELNEAVAVALEDADSGEKWLSGEAVFASAHMAGR